MPARGAMGGSPDLLVVGGGAWGSWTALLARKLGARVTLMEAAEPGHRDSTSGDYSRIFRHSHGEDELLLGWARKSLAAWKALAAMSGEELFVESGVAWCVSDLGAWEAESEKRLRAAGVPHERLSAEEAVKRWPAMSPAALASVLYEPTAGFLRAANGVRAVSRAFTQAGGTLVQGRARAAADGSALDANGAPIAAGAVVWAAGSSLPGLFPDLVGADTPAEITPVRRDVAYFNAKGMGVGEIPTWIDAGIGVWGIPNESGHGAKVGPDFDAGSFNPDVKWPSEASEESLQVARQRAGIRFPSILDASLKESRACQHERTLTWHYVIDHHPENDRVWIAGGGSGHGYKQAPAVGEALARAALNRAPLAMPDSRFKILGRAQGPSSPAGEPNGDSV